MKKSEKIFASVLKKNGIKVILPKVEYEKLVKPDIVNKKVFDKPKEFEPVKNPKKMQFSKTRNLKTMMAIEDLITKGKTIEINGERVFYKYTNKLGNEKRVFVGFFHDFIQDYLLTPGIKSTIPVANSSGIKRFSEFGKRVKDNKLSFYYNMIADDLDSKKEFVRINQGGANYRKYTFTNMNNEVVEFLRRENSDYIYVNEK